MFGRRRTTRAQARRDREWREFVSDLTETATQISAADDERLRAFLDRQDAGGSDGSRAPADARGRRREPPAERAA
jgi:hypothetical protein